MKKTTLIILAALTLTSCTARTETTTEATATTEATTPSTIITTHGTFHGSFDDTNGERLYQFRSYDNETWWLLTEEEIGHIPTTSDEYILTYDNGNTPVQDLTICGCDPEWECECHVYDDEFIKIERR